MFVTAKPLYRTKLGAAYVGESCRLLGELPNDSIDLVVTSPPFALRRQKTYGNVPETEYVDWLMPFCRQVHRVLKDTGSFVLDLGGAYCAGLPTRSLYNFRVLVALCDDLGFFLAEEFYWFNPAKLPSPIEWVNKRKIRAKDSVDTVWWFSKTPEPKADVRKVLTPYSERMKKLLADPDNYYQPDKRPSGHDIGRKFATDNGGAIPSNLLSIPNTDSNSFYLRMCKRFDLERHPARFPEELPAFFIKMLTDPGDFVIDIFSGSNTTGVASERLSRRWLSLDISHEYLRTSALRFLEGSSEAEMKDILDSLRQQNADVLIPTVVLSEVPNIAVERNSMKDSLPFFS